MLVYPNLGIFSLYSQEPSFQVGVLNSLLIASISHIISSLSFAGFSPLFGILSINIPLNYIIFSSIC